MGGNIESGSEAVALPAHLPHGDNARHLAALPVGTCLAFSSDKRVVLVLVDRLTSALPSTPDPVVLVRRELRASLLSLTKSLTRGSSTTLRNNH